MIKPTHSDKALMCMLLPGCNFGKDNMLKHAAWWHLPASMQLHINYFRGFIINWIRLAIVEGWYSLDDFEMLVKYGFGRALVCCMVRRGLIGIALRWGLYLFSLFNSQAIKMIYKYFRVGKSFETKTIFGTYNKKQNSIFNFSYLSHA